MLGLRACATTYSLYSVRDQAQGLVHGRQILYQLPYIFSPSPANFYCLMSSINLVIVLDSLTLWVWAPTRQQFCFNIYIGNLFSFLQAQYSASRILEGNYMLDE